jgi:hypothetical protein
MRALTGARRRHVAGAIRARWATGARGESSRWKVSPQRARRVLPGRIRAEQHVTGLANRCEKQAGWTPIVGNKDAKSVCTRKQQHGRRWIDCVTVNCRHLHAVQVNSCAIVCTESKSRMEGSGLKVCKTIQ